jgi:hypothetical protein
LAQIVKAKLCASVGHLHERVGRRSVRPLDGDPLQSAIIALHIQTIFSPAFAVIDKLELTPEVWVEWMGDTNEPTRILDSVCS